MFRVGDRVRYIGVLIPSLRSQYGIVVHVHDNPVNPVTVKWSGGQVGRHGSTSVQKVNIGPVSQVFR